MEASVLIILAVCTFYRLLCRTLALSNKSSFMLRAEKFFCRWLNLKHCSNSDVRQWPLLVPTASSKPRSAAQMNLVGKSEYSFVANYPYLSTDCSQCISSSTEFQVLIFFRILICTCTKILLEHLSFKLCMLFLETLNVYKI